ncbi:hypothetical protein HK097_002788, partial [Rhizophlyctis rosea]
MKPLLLLLFILPLIKALPQASRTNSTNTGSGRNSTSSSGNDTSSSRNDSATKGKATWGRIAPAVATINGSVLILGGDVRTQYGTEDRNLTNGTTVVQSSITTLNLTTLSVEDVSVEAPSGDSENRMQLRAQTCVSHNQTARVYCFGGKYNDNLQGKEGLLASNIGVLDPATMKWEDDLDVNVTGRWGHSMILLGNTTYIFGGDLSSNNNTADLYSVHLPSLNTTLLTVNSTSSTNSSSSSNSTTPPPRSYHCAAPINGTAFIIVGGRNGDETYGDAWVYEVQEGSWSNVTGSMKGSVEGLARWGRMCVWSDGLVWMFGGSDGSTLTNEMFSLDPSDFTFTNHTSNSTSSSSSRRDKRQNNNANSTNPTARAFSVLAPLPPYIALFGGEDYYDTDLGDYVANDTSFRFFNTRNTSWLAQPPTLTAALIPAVVPGQVDPVAAGAAGAAGGAVTQPSPVVTGPSPTATPSPTGAGDPDDGNESKIAAAIVGALLLALLCCAWCFVVRLFKKHRREQHRNGIRLAGSEGALLPTSTRSNQYQQTRAPEMTTTRPNPAVMVSPPPQDTTATEHGHPHPGGASIAGAVAAALTTGIATALTSHVPHNQPRPTTGAEAVNAPKPSTESTTIAPTAAAAAAATPTASTRAQNPTPPPTKTPHRRA